MRDLPPDPFAELPPGLAFVDKGQVLWNTLMAFDTFSEAQSAVAALEEEDLRNIVLTLLTVQKHMALGDEGMRAWMR